MKHFSVLTRSTSFLNAYKNLHRILRLFSNHSQLSRNYLTCIRTKSCFLLLNDRLVKITMQVTSCAYDINNELSSSSFTLSNQMMMIITHRFLLFFLLKWVSLLLDNLFNIKRSLLLALQVWCTFDTQLLFSSFYSWSIFTNMSRNISIWSMFDQ
jgi:hypothetical protein